VNAAQVETIGESLFGDVYAEPSKWRPLSAGELLHRGLEPSVGEPPPGEGGERCARAAIVES